MEALLIIDIQNDYFEGGANPLYGSNEAVKQAALVLNYFRQRKLPVIHVQHLSVRPGSTFFVPGTKGAEIHTMVKPIDGEALIVKNFPNSFRQTGLKEALEKHNVKRLIICGMMTHMCVDATVRAAKDMGYECVVIADACATKDLEVLGRKSTAAEVHYAFIAAINYYYAEVKTADYFVNG